MKKIFQLVYISRAPEDINYTDIQEILAVSLANNVAQDITGLLIFRDGYFLQALEGEEAAVRRLMSKIKEDDRNYALKILVEGEAVQRFFARTPMAFLDGDLSVNETTDLINLFDIAMAPGGSSKKNFVIPLLQSISTSMHIS